MEDYSRAANFGAQMGMVLNQFLVSLDGDVRKLEDITKLNIHKCFTISIIYMKEKGRDWKHNK